MTMVMAVVFHTHTQGVKGDLRELYSEMAKKRVNLTLML